MIGKRGKLVTVPSSPGTVGATTLLALLPSNAVNSTAFSILASTDAGHFRDWSVAWEIQSGCGWEVLFDRYRLRDEGVLSLFMINGTEVQVWDFTLEGS